MTYPRDLLVDLLELEPFKRCRPEILCGEHLLDRPVRWIHTSELAEAPSLLKGEELLLTSGLGLSGRGLPGIRSYIATLGDRRAALALELGWTFSKVPDQMLDAARQHDVPVIALHEVVGFVELTEAGQEAILLRRLLSRPPAPDGRVAHRARLLQDLESRQISPSELKHRLSIAGVGPTYENYSALIIRGYRHGFAGTLEGALLASVEGSGALLTTRDGDMAILAPTRASSDVGVEILAVVDSICRSRGEAATCRLAVSKPGPIIDVAPRLSDARHALSLAASLGIDSRILSAPLISSRMVLNRLAGDALAEKLVHAELGNLIVHDDRHATRLVSTLTYYLKHGSNVRSASLALNCSRQSFYKRKELITRLIGDVDAPERHANLVIAVELHQLFKRFAH